MLQNKRTAICTICYLLLSRGHCCKSTTHRPGFYPGMFWGSFPPKTCNSPKNFCHVGNYNLNIEAKSNANYSTEFVICYLRYQQSKLFKSPLFQQTPRFQQKTRQQAYSRSAIYYSIIKGRMYLTLSHNWSTSKSFGILVCDSATCV